MKEILKSNYKLKIFSIITAFFVWVFVMAEVDPIITRTIDNIPVTTITNQAEIDEKELVISPNSKITAQITIKGRRSFVSSYISNELIVTGTVVSPTLGKNQVELLVQRKDNLEISINPISSQIELENIDRVRKIITTRFTGNAVSDYEVYNVSLNPDTTLVEGPKSLVEQVSEVIASINIQGVDKDFIQNVKLEAIDSSGDIVDGVKLQIRYVEATVVIHKVKTVPIRLIITDGTKELKLENYYLEPSEIQIKGIESMIDSTNEIKTVPILLEQLENSDNMQVNLNLPEGIRSNIYYAKIGIDSSQSITDSIEFTKDDIVIEGYTDEEKAVIYNSLPETVRASIFYSKGLEEKLEGAEVKLYVDQQKSDFDSDKFYFGVRSNVPYLKADISPSVINKIS